MLVDPGQETMTPLSLAGPLDEEAQRLAVWEELLALRAQAIMEGMKLMTLDEVNTEVQSRRGGVVSG